MGYLLIKVRIVGFHDAKFLQVINKVSKNVLSLNLRRFFMPYEVSIGEENNIVKTRIGFF
jgi:hypothetical protein